MKYIHKDLQRGRWAKLSFIDQMANIGSEVFRAIKWQKKNSSDSQKAFYRALELFEMTLADPKNRLRLKEVCRAKELFSGWYLGNSPFSLSAKDWEKYFFQFNLASRLHT